MNRETLKGQWLQLKGKVRERWGDLTDDDLDRVAGNWDQLVGKIQERYGHRREEIERDLDHLMARPAHRDGH